MDIYDIDELGPTTSTVFQIFANNNQAMKINTLFDTGAMKSVMSLEMYKKLKLNDLNTTSIPKSAFVLSSLGKYQFNRVPFGLAQAPAYFQKLINDVL